MRILALVPSFYGYTGDAVNERQLIIALARKVEKCYVITFVGFKQLFTHRRKELKVNLPKNITVIPIPFPHLTMIITMVITPFIAAIFGLILNIVKKIDLIYIRTSFLSICFLTFQSLARKTIVKIPAIIEDEIPDGFIKFLVKNAADILDRLVLAKARKIAVNGKLMYREIVKRRSFKHKDEPLEIPPGVDLQAIEKLKRQVTKTPQDTINIGFIGSLHRWQGVENLVKAIAILNKKKFNLKLTIIGDGELRPFIEELCKALRINYEITGFLPHEEALKRLSMLDIMVLPSRRISTTESNIPIKVIEAWALGIPVIVARHRVFLENGIKDREDVIFCEPEPVSIANAISTLLNDDVLRNRLAMNGQRLAKRFNYNNIAEILLKSIT